MMLLSLFVAAVALAGASNAVVPPFHHSRAAADLQSSLVLDRSQVQPGLANNGQANPEAGQVASLTSGNNFINFCATQNGVPLTNGKQIKTGSCNPTIMGRILATNKLPSSKFTFPTNGGTVPAGQTFTIKMAINNMVTGNFVNAQANYYSAPCQVDRTGTVIGHSHVVVEKIDSLQSKATTTPTQFAFFKGLNLAAANGVLSADVTGGLAPGAYRLASINTCANHQPVLGSVAQHGHFDDMIYFTVATGGAGAPGSSASTASTSVASSVSTSVSKAASSSAVSATPATTGSVGGNLQTFTGSAGGIRAPPVTGPNTQGRFTCQGNTFATKAAALQRSCDIQHNACANRANSTGNRGNLNQTTCQNQLNACLASARQGFNRYYPPDFDPQKHVTLNTYHGKHALGDRARKIDKGILITRFELPFNIWCGTCNNHIGMGVRYNAEKKKVGNYYSTPIYSFRCKCHLCSGWFEIQTDPKNTAYVVVSGARKQEQDWDPEENGGFAIHDLGAGPSSTGDAIASLEKTTVAEENLNNVVKPRISMLSDLSGRRNSDPYTLSKKLRGTFRETKKAEKRAREEEDSVRNKFGLSTELELVKEDDVREEAREEWQRARREYKLEEDVRQKTFRSQHGSLGLNSHPKMKSSRVAGSSLSSAKSTLAASLLRNSLKKSDPFTMSSSSTSLPQATRARHS